ncbi:universal stress protein [Knoellia subterranea]|uniref:UspA domain-containing protein n=1 Tax=Knoellia subterranea KCTC 19937 TaxID=1385521 RepID=A0A0A0JQE1_9MICO|nr:universal stress protein [Knoellia subterranea]KGN37811.1 hypothetical protein N803_12185 [Knoellia subterranea KCTC 19937]
MSTATSTQQSSIEPSRPPKPIVVGVDGTPSGGQVASWALREAASLDAPLQVVYAAEPPRAVSVAPSPVELRALCRSVALRAVQNARAQLDGDAVDVRVTAVGEVGTPGAELVARSVGAELVVVGREGSGGLGAVSLAATVHARCPVVVVPVDLPEAAAGDATEGVRSVDLARGGRPVDAAPPSLSAPAPVVVGVDGSRAEDTLDLAAGFARSREVPIVVFAAWQSPEGEPWSDELPSSPTLRTTVRVEELARAHANVVRAAATIRRRHPGLEVTTRVQRADPTRALIDSSAEASVLVLGSRGVGGFPGLMLGSVTLGVVGASRCPVAVMRRGALQ